jgi:hypothetical protein
MQRSLGILFAHDKKKRNDYGKVWKNSAAQSKEGNA